MKYCLRICLCLVLALPVIALWAQDNKPIENKNVFRVVKSSNGQSFLLCNTQSPVIHTDIYFRIGPIYEFDSVSGISDILSRVISSHIRSGLRSDGRQLKYYSTVEPDLIGFHFESGVADLPYILDIANGKIMQATFDESGLEEAKTELRADLDSSNATATYRSEDRITRLLWGKDYKKLNAYGDQKTYANIQLRDLENFYHKYFLPFNNAVSVTGAFSQKDVLDKLQTTFKNFKSNEFNPELITKVLDFKPIINTIQIVAPTDGKTTVSVTYQNPGARQDRDMTYCAYILSEMINDKNGRIQKAVKAAGLKNIKAIYTCNNFYGTFSISAEAGGNINGAFATITDLINDITTKEYFKDTDLVVAKRNITMEYQDLQSNHLMDYMTMVSRYRFSNDENYFTSLPDSVNDVSVAGMRRYAGDYYANHQGLRCLYASDTTSMADTTGQQYFPLDGSVADIKFIYDLNKTDIETPQAKVDLQRLIQWLKINPDVHVQINGFSDEGEFTKAYDDTIKRFIDSTATFHKAMPDAYKKGYLRIEFMRAMKIAKAIYEAGITEDRITGTSMVFTSETREQAAANRKCTVTLEKIKPRLSLYEYHFGKKKDEAQN